MNRFLGLVIFEVSRLLKSNYISKQKSASHYVIRNEMTYWTIFAGALILFRGRVESATLGLAPQSWKIPRAEKGITCA